MKLIFINGLFLISVSKAAYRGLESSFGLTWPPGCFNDRHQLLVSWLCQWNGPFKPQATSCQAQQEALV